jgi:hypothetical protein
MKNEEFPHRIKEEWNIPQGMKRSNYIGLVTPCVGTAF